MILHHIQKSPAQDAALKMCLRFIAKEDALLLSGDAVAAPMLRQWSMALSPYKVFLLEDDVIARGLGGHLGKYTQVSYERWVELTLQYQKVITW